MLKLVNEWNCYLLLKPVLLEVNIAIKLLQCGILIPQYY